VTQPSVSVVIPVLNEAGNLLPLYEQLTAVLHEAGRPYEMVFVDDGSDDRSPAIMAELFQRDPEHVRVVEFRRNFGKTAALSAGFAQTRGELVITMDADLQDDPAEIPAMLAKLEEGYDLVAAWRFPRQDAFDKTLPSRVFNFVVSRVTGVRVHDFNCGFKAYRRAVTDTLHLYGELHRFIPVLAHQKGFRVTELKVVHHPRRAGRSKYGSRRLLRGFVDFGIVMFLTTYLKRPMHLFGTAGASVFGLGTLINLYLAVLWLLREVGGMSQIGPIGTRPLLIVGVLAMILGVELISIGLLGELVRYFTLRPDEEYTVRRVLTPNVRNTKATK